jgi:hypothetical protein
MATKSKTTPAAAAAGPANKGLKVVCATEGFRRGGRAFGREAVIVPLSELSADQAQAILEEPRLAAVEVDIETTAE